MKKTLTAALLLAFSLQPLALIGQTTQVLFPVNTLFGGATYNRPLTITAANTLISDGQNLWAGTYTIVPASTTNPVVSLYPNTYLLTVSGVVKPVRFTVPGNQGTNILDVTTLITSGPLFYFGTNGMANLIAGINISFITNGDGSIDINAAGGGNFGLITNASYATNANYAVAAGALAPGSGSNALVLAGTALQPGSALPAANLTGTVPAGALPASVVTNGQPSVTFGGLSVGGGTVSANIGNFANISGTPVLNGANISGVTSNGITSVNPGQIYPPIFAGASYTNASTAAGLIIGSSIGTNVTLAQLPPQVIAATLGTNFSLATNIIVVTGGGSAAYNLNYFWNTTLGYFTNSTGFCRGQSGNFIYLSPMPFSTTSYGYSKHGLNGYAVGPLGSPPVPTEAYPTNATVVTNLPNIVLRQQPSTECWIDPINGDDLTGTGSRTDPFATFALAKSVFTGHAVFHLGAGLFTEQITVPDYSIVAGSGKDVTFVSGVLILTNNGIVQDLTVSNNVATFLVASNCIGRFKNCRIGYDIDHGVNSGIDGFYGENSRYGLPSGYNYGTLVLDGVDVASSCDLFAIFDNEVNPFSVFYVIGGTWRSINSSTNSINLAHGILMPQGGSQWYVSGTTFIVSNAFALPPQLTNNNGCNCFFYVPSNTIVNASGCNYVNAGTAGTNNYVPFLVDTGGILNINGQFASTPVWEVATNDSRPVVLLCQSNQFGGTFTGNGAGLTNLMLVSTNGTGITFTRPIWTNSAFTHGFILQVTNGLIVGNPVF